jgi:hypothetical protein
MREEAAGEEVRHLNPLDMYRFDLSHFSKKPS